MRFPVEIHEADAPLMLERMLQITGHEPWTKRLEWLAREADENRYMIDWLRERFGLEWELHASIQSDDLQGKGKFRVNSAARYELAAFAAGVVQIYEGLTLNGRNRLRGMLLDGLKEEKGLLPLQHEVSTAVHLVRLGFDVEFHDLETGGGFDFLAKRGNAEVEIECKMFSADVGRKIHRRLSAKLFKVLGPTLDQVFQTATRGLLVRITIPERLTPSPQQHEGIRRTVERALIAASPFESEDCVVTVQDFAIEGSPFAAKSFSQIPKAVARRFISDLTGQRNPTLMMFVSPGKRTVVTLLESEQPDAVLKGIRRQLRDAASDQFSRTRPGCLVAQLHDLNEEQLRSLAMEDSNSRPSAHGLQIMTSDLLQTATRSHIHSIVYRAKPVTPSEDDGMISSPSSTYVIRNAGHPLASDPAYAVFGETIATGPRILLST